MLPSSYLASSDSLRAYSSQTAGSASFTPPVSVWWKAPIVSGKIAPEAKTGTSSGTKNFILRIRRRRTPQALPGISMEAMALDRNRRDRLALGAGATVACLVAAKLLVHLYAGRHYGYFRDELYYLACSHHLDWGYVDQPPLIALIVAIVRNVLGQGLLAIRLVPALAGAAEVALTAL